MMLDDDLRRTCLPNDVDDTQFPAHTPAYCSAEIPLHICTAGTPSDWDSSAMQSTNGASTPSSRSDFEVPHMHNQQSEQVRTSRSAGFKASALISESVLIFIGL